MLNNSITIDGKEYVLDDMSLGELISLEQIATGEAAHPVIRSLICDLSLSPADMAKQRCNHQKRMKQKTRHRYKGYGN